MIEGDYRPTPPVEAKIEALHSLFEGADVNSVEGQYFIDKSIWNALHEEKVQQLDSLKSESDPDSREKIMSDLRIAEGGISTINLSIEYKRRTLPGYREASDEVEKRWSEFGESLFDEAANLFEDGESRTEYWNSVASLVRENISQTLLANSRPQS